MTDKLTPKQRAEYRFFFDAVSQFEWDLRHRLWGLGAVPREWLDLVETDRSPTKTRVTLRLDEDVVKFLRHQWGQGWQTRANTILRAFFKLRLSQAARGATGLDLLLEAAEDAADGRRRPRLGEAEEKIARMLRGQR